jgi:hypothetical protein
MSANTLTNLIPNLYKAADTVAREQTGFIAACYKDSDVEQVAKDQVIYYPIVGAQTATSISPAATGPDPSGQTVGNGSMTIDKSYSVKFPWTANEQMSVRALYQQILTDQFAQSMRTLVNLIETDLFLAAKRNASRAYGTAGTTPFGTAGDFSDFAQTLKILIDNGAPQSDLHMVLNTTSAAKIRGLQSSLFKVNEAGDGGSLLRDGNLGTIERMMMHESAAIVSHTKGTGTAWVFNGTHAVGVTTITAKSGSNTLLYGDVLAFEDDTTRKYVANSTLSANVFTIGGPGLLQQQTDGKTITIGNNYTGNWAFDRNALHLLTRVPAMPEGGDSAQDVVVITDPYSGLSFQIALYRQYRQVVYEVGIAWGVKAVKSDFIATLLG